MNVIARTVPDGRRHQVELPAGATSGTLVRALGMPTAGCLVLRGRLPLPIDEALVDGEELEVIYVASGG